MRMPSCRADASCGRSGHASGQKSDPIQVSFLGAKAIVQIPNPLPDLIQQVGRLQWGIAGFRGIFITV